MRRGRYEDNQVVTSMKATKNMSTELREQIQSEVARGHSRNLLDGHDMSEFSSSFGASFALRRNHCGEEHRGHHLGVASDGGLRSHRQR